VLNDSQGKQPYKYLVNKKVISILIQTGCLTFVIALGAILTGLWLDNRLQTRPWLTMLLVLISAPIAFVFVYLRVKTATANLNKPREGNSRKAEEETTLGGKTET